MVTRYRSRFGVFAVLAFAAVASADEPVFEGATECQGKNGTYLCGPGLVCQPETDSCGPAAKAGPGEKLCEDNVTVCPADRQCNMEGSGDDRCLVAGSRRCQPSGAQPFWCKPPQVCNDKEARCVDPATPGPGEKLCEDGLTVCPADRACNMEGYGSYRCLVPGSRRCEPSPGEIFWCTPPKVCNDKEAKCVEPTKPGPGEKLCEDGLTVCPADRECNMEGSGSYRCLVPGSARCEAEFGPPWWCTPPKICDLPAQTCRDATGPAIDFPPSPGATARVAGSWSVICNPSIPDISKSYSGAYVIDIVPSPTNVVGELTGDVGTIPLEGFYDSRDGSITFSTPISRTPNIGLFGTLTPDGAHFKAEGKINATIERGSCVGEWSGHSPT